MVMSGDARQQAGVDPRFPIPPRQQPYLRAFELGFDLLDSLDPTGARLPALGAECARGLIRLPSLRRVLVIDPAHREVRVDGGGRLHHTWALLALHYLCATDVTADAREVSLKHFDDCRGYLDAFNRRIIGRFLATAGRTREQFIARCEEQGATRLSGTAVSFEFALFPRLPLVLIRYDEDEEIGPGANLIFHRDAEYLLPPEDRIVAAELLLDLLTGKSLIETP